jgi:hypothetical protein
MEDVKFIDTLSFYQFVASHPSLRESEAVLRFCEAFEQINVGCGCQKKARLARSERFFMALSPELTTNEKAEIKNLAGGAEVKFYDKNGNLFLQI